MAEHGAPSGKGPARYEPSAVNVRGVAWFIVLLLVALGLVVFAAQLTFDELRARRPRPVIPEARVLPSGLPPEPRLEVSPPTTLRELRAEEERILTGYAWVDREQGIARVPIDEAMRLLLQSGLPVRSTEGAAPRQAADRPAGGRAKKKGRAVLPKDR